MAKGDHKRVQNEIDRQWNDQAQYLSTLSNRLYDTSNMFTEGYRQGMPMNLGSYDEIMHNYRNFMQNPLNPFMGYGQSAQSGYFNPMGGSGQQGFAPMGGNYQQIFESLIGDRAPSLESLVAMEPELKKHGIQLEWNARRNGADIRLPNGQIVDVVGGLENPDPSKRSWTWQDDGPGMGQGQDFSGILGDFYKNLMENGGGLGWDSLFRGALGDAIGTFGEFSKTGGLSERDRQDLRARGEAAVRAVYGHGVDQLNRQRALQPFSPNYNAALAKMTRDRSYANADALTMNNAEIARMVQQGRLAGAQGLTSAGLGGQAASSRIDEGNLGARLSGAAGLRGMQNDADAMDLATAGMRLNALQGMTGLYGTTPALINTFGNQVLGANNQLLGLNELRQGLGNQMIQGRLSGSQVPGNFSQAMGNIGSTLGMVGRVAGAFTGLGGLNPFSWGGGGSGNYNPGRMGYEPRLGGYY